MEVTASRSTASLVFCSLSAPETGSGEWEVPRSTSPMCDLRFLRGAVLKAVVTRRHPDTEVF